MVFSSPLFLFLYLPAVFAAQAVTPRRWRYLTLLAVSLFFYGWGEPVYILLMTASILIGFAHGRAVAALRRRGNERGAKLALVSSAVCNLGLLFFFKYWDFLAASLAAAGLPLLPILNLPLPIGISFYTFQTMSYVIDVYRGDAAEQRNPLKYGMFVTLFPQLTAGPIIKYKELEAQLGSPSADALRFASGVQTFTVGLAKKVLLANNLGTLWEVYSALPLSDLTTAGAWLGLAAFTLQIYFDFSGYSDMAIGLGRMLGFEFPENFRYPYAARSVTEFWRRWHISLGSWFREYLYIPLGGNRVGKLRLCGNLLLVWALTGLWHGASWNFLLWGLYFWLLLMLEKLVLGRVLPRLPAAVGHGYTLLLVMLSWAIFSIEDISHLLGYLAALFGGATGGLTNGAAGFYLRAYLPVLIIGALACLPAGAQLFHRLGERTRRVVGPLLLLLALIACAAYLVDATYNPFLYFRF